jgi:serine/threonine protein kinase, bacterial
MSVTLLNHRYQILETLARGGFGETYIAIDTQMPSKRRCVIKKLQPAIQAAEMPPWLQERFEREAVILEELGEQHPQIPRLYGYFSEGNDFYLVQEWIEGVTLTQKQREKGKLSESEVREILLRLLPVLEFIHSRRIIHRDVKPDNIILRKQDNLPVLIDFGVMKEAVATLVDPMGKSAYSIALGTPGYMASEQAAGRPVYSSDLYSLGLTAIFLLTGKTPQYLETDSRSGEILWRQEAGDLHSPLAMVLDQAIRFHPRDRYATASEMLAALEGMATDLTNIPTVVAPSGDRSSKPPRPVAEPPQVTETPSRFAWFPLVVVTIGAFVLGYLGFMTLLPKGDRPQPVSTPSVSPSPESSPVPIESPVVQPQPQRSPAARPRRTRRPTPTPEITPSPSPEVIIPPTPEPSPETTPEGGETPPASPSPEPTPTSIPIPVEPPSPSPEPSPSAVPTKPDSIEGKAKPGPPPESEPTVPETNPSPF